jgi:hypothetical protein
MNRILLLLSVLLAFFASSHTLWPVGARAGSTAAAEVSSTFEAVDEANGNQVIGIVHLDATYRMTIEQAGAGRELWLAGVVAEINAKDALTIEVPPSSSAPRYARQGLPIERNDPRFFTAMRSYLHRYYALGLH